MSYIFRVYNFCVCSFIAHSVYTTEKWNTFLVSLICSTLNCYIGFIERTELLPVFIDFLCKFSTNRQTWFYTFAGNVTVSHKSRYI